MDSLSNYPDDLGQVTQTSLVVVVVYDLSAKWA